MKVGPLQTKLSGSAHVQTTPGFHQGLQHFFADQTFALELDFVCLFVCFVALRPKSTDMVIAGRSVHLTTLFPGQA